MRLFVAIDLNDEARRAIAEVQQQLARAMGDPKRSPLKWARPDHMHLTLAFLGDVAETRVPDVVRAIEPDIQVAPFTMALGGVGVFPPRGAPRVLWLGLRAGAESVAASQLAVAMRLEGIGITLEQRPFHPHLTLARWRTSRSSDARHLPDADRAGEIARLSVRHVTLFHSQLSPGGSTYRALTRATLR